MIAVFETTGSGQDAFNFYRNSTTLKVSEVKTVGVGGAFVGRLHFTDGHSATVTVSDVDSRTLIVIYLHSGSSQTSPVSGAR